MSTVASLMYLYFAAGAWRRWFLLTGAGAIAIFIVMMQIDAPKTYVAPIAFAGVACVFLGTTLLSIVPPRLFNSRIACVLPHSRSRIFLSALLTTALVAMPTPILATILMRATFRQYRAVSWFDTVQSPFFIQMFLVSFLLCSWMYIVQWLLTVARSSKRVIGAIILVFSMVSLPPQFISIETAKSQHAPLVLAAATWLGFAVYGFWWPRLREWRRSLPPINWSDAMSAYPVGRETVSLLGIGSRWIHALAVALIVGVCAFLYDEGMSTLFRLITAQLAVFGGAISGITTSRSRALWLRSPWDRAAMFAGVEALYWRYMSVNLVVLLIGSVIAAAYAGASIVSVGLHVSLVALTYFMSTYLGFMQTHGSPWRDVWIAVPVVLAIMWLAVYGGRNTADLRLVVCSQLALGALGANFRWVAVRRWHAIDWSTCRPFRTA